MTWITILGVDPGLGTSGTALAIVDSLTGKIEDILELGVFETRKSQHRTVRKTSDDLRRAKEAAGNLRRILGESRVDIVAAEMATTTPYTYPTFSFGVMTGILASLDYPIIEVLPYEVKAAATGNDRATKRDIIAWALSLPSSQPLSWPTSRRSNQLKLTYNGENVTRAAEHPADALAVIQAAVRTEQFRLALSLMVHAK